MTDHYYGRGCLIPLVILATLAFAGCVSKYINIYPQNCQVNVGQEVLTSPHAEAASTVTNEEGGEGQ